MLPFFFCSESFKRTSILCRPILYWQRRTNSRYVYFIAWLGQRNSNSKQFHCRKILAGKIMSLFLTFRFSRIVWFVCNNVRSLSPFLALIIGLLVLQSRGPQCNLYVPAPILQHGKNLLVWDANTFFWDANTLSSIVIYISCLNVLCRSYLK